jgi:hypothetical protein
MDAPFFERCHPDHGLEPMTDNRTISQLEAKAILWIGCECCKGTVFWMSA